MIAEMGLRSRIIGAVILVLLAVGGLVGLFSGPLPGAVGAPIAAALSVVPGSIVRVLVVGLLLVGGLYYLRDRPGDTEPLVPDGRSLEQPRNAPQIAGEPFDDAIETAVREIRLKGTPVEETEPYRVLRSLAEDGVALRRGCSETQAAAIVDDGEWTADPIAAAFLGTVEYPVRFHMLRWAQPAAAYEQAIEQTAVEVQQITAGMGVAETGGSSGEWAGSDRGETASEESADSAQLAEPSVGGDQ